MAAVGAEPQNTLDPMTLTWQDVYSRIRQLPPGRPFGVPRGGAIVAGLVGNPAATPEEADYIVDDIIDSGATRDRYAKSHPGKPFVALVDKLGADAGAGWVVFPWEHTDQNQDVAENVRRLLQAIGEDTTREGLKDTPKRVVKALREMTVGYKQNPEQILGTTFDGSGYDQMVVCKDIEFTSMCEHHMLPFVGKAHVAYIPNGRVVGLSKMARLVDCYAKRLQIQEKMTGEIADAMNTHLKPHGVGVVISAQHMCMRCRGVQKGGSTMVTSALHGVFRFHQVRAEFLSLVK